MMSRDVHQFLVDCKRPCTAQQISATVLPGCDKRRLNGVITGLLRYGKIRVAGKRGGRNLYTFVAGAPVRRTNEAEPLPDTRTKPVAAAPTTRKKAEHSATIAAPPANPHGGIHARDKADQSAQIAADIAAFESRGGRIQKLRNGEVSQPLQHIGLHPFAEPINHRRKSA